MECYCEEDINFNDFEEENLQHLGPSLTTWRSLDFGQQLMIDMDNCRFLPPEHQQKIIDEDADELMNTIVKVKTLNMTPWLRRQCIDLLKHITPTLDNYDLFKELAYELRQVWKGHYEVDHLIIAIRAWDLCVPPHCGSEGATHTLVQPSQYGQKSIRVHGQPEGDGDFQEDGHYQELMAEILQVFLWVERDL